MVVWCSRNSENNTSKYPDLAADVPKLLKEGCTSVVLDCEAVAYDRVTKKILPFQVIPFAGPSLLCLSGSSLCLPFTLASLPFQTLSPVKVLCCTITCSICPAALSFAFAPLPF